MATTTWKLKAPNRTDWEVNGKWHCELAFEPPAATRKRVDYSLDPKKTYRIVRNFQVGNSNQFLPIYSAELPGSAFGGILPDGTVNSQPNIPLNDRDREWWFEEAVITP